MQQNTQSILPRFDAFAGMSGAAGMGGMGAYARPLARHANNGGQSGMGSIFALSPVVAAMKGLGANDGERGDGFDVAWNRANSGTFVLGLAILGAVGALSYQAGKAMAPSGGDKAMWGWVGVPVGLFTGALGLGVMGFVANQKGG
jgi:hypothetical protein